MKAADILIFIFPLTMVAVLYMSTPTLIWFTTFDRDCAYPYHVTDINNMNNGGQYLHDGIVKQNILLVKNFTTDNNSNIILTDYAYQDGREFIEVTDKPLTIPIIKANLGSRND